MNPSYDVKGSSLDLPLCFTSVCVRVYTEYRGHCQRVPNLLAYVGLCAFLFMLPKRITIPGREISSRWLDNY
jgi:hypothetical protein